MEYIDYYESRPRFVFSTRPAAASAAVDTQHRRPAAVHAATCILSAATLFIAAYYFYDSSFLSSIFAWIAVSLLLGPFAPQNLTGGDPTVGRGPPIPDLVETAAHPDGEVADTKKRSSGRRSRPGPTPLPPQTSTEQASSKAYSSEATEPSEKGVRSQKMQPEEERDWTDEEFEILKKQMLKHPVGEPRRWERIAEGFNGRYSVSSIIAAAKSLSEKRPAEEDSYAQFLKMRKPLDKRTEAAGGGDSIESKREEWTSAEDLALLNALKAFPKDIGMRWEKIASAIPGKTKAGCMKRLAELKKDFRSSKASQA